MRPAALSAVIALSGAGLIGCGTGSTATVPPGAASAGSGTVSAGRGSASPGVIVSVPASPAGSSAGGTGNSPGHQLLTVADDGASVRLRTGQVITVVLDSGGLQWDIPRASGTAVRRISGSGGYPAFRPAVAAFRAVRPGRSWLTSITDARCLHTQPRCAIPQRLWRALIIVRNA